LSYFLCTCVSSIFAATVTLFIVFGNKFYTILYSGDSIIHTIEKNLKRYQVRVSELSVELARYKSIEQFQKNEAENSTTESTRKSSIRFQNTSVAKSTKKKEEQDESDSTLSLEDLKI